MVRHANDQFFKAAFGRVEVAKAFLQSRLKKAIIARVKLHTLTPQKSSFVSKALQAHDRDVVYWGIGRQGHAMCIFSLSSKVG